MVDSRMTGDPKPFDTTIADPVERIQRYIDSYQNDSNYEVRMYSQPRIARGQKIEKRERKRKHLFLPLQGSLTSH